jgi:atypical dual specificity phosphatase
VLRRLKFLLYGMGVLVDRGVWIEEDRVLGCAYPRSEKALAALAARGVTVLVNLHRRHHPCDRLNRHGLVEIHLPVADFTAPTPEQLDRGVRSAVDAVAEGKTVAVHCGGGLGRTGTLLACYLVHGGLDADTAVAKVRAARPGSIETAGQLRAVRDYAGRVRG